jgi:NAD+ synthase
VTAGPLQQQIRFEMQVADAFDAGHEAQRRVDFLADYLRTSGASGYVLGISGGVDSTTTGRLAQLACEQAGGSFTAVRLPYGVQADEADAQAALAFTGPSPSTSLRRPMRCTRRSRSRAGTPRRQQRTSSGATPRRACG